MEGSSEPKEQVAVEKEDKKEPSATFYQVFSNADSYDILLMIVGSLGGIVTGVSLPLFNVLFGQILDKLNGDPDSFVEKINLLCVIMVIVAVGNFISGFLQVYCWTATGERQTQKFRERYVRAVLSQEIGWFDTCGASELSTKLAELVGKIQDGMGRKVGDLIQYIAQIIGSFVVSFYLSWKLTVVLLASIPMIGMAGAFMINSVTAAQNESLEQYAAAGGLATETISAIRTVTALNMQPGVITKYRKYLFEAMRVGVIKGLNVGIGNGGLFCVCFFTYALGFWYGGKLVADDLDSGCSGNCLTGGNVMSVFFSTIMGSMALGQMAPPMIAFFAGKAAVARIYEVLDRKPLIDGLSDEGERPDVKISGAIELKDVVFAYPSRPNIDVCRGYNLQINPGETVALVGASGCGKSTIINLLLRFYDPKSGVISLDGYDIKSLNIKWLRSHIGYVGQEPILFSGTVGDNIAYGVNPELKDSLTSKKESDVHSKRDDHEKQDKDALMEQVIAAAKLSNAHDFIKEFPHGYETDVGSNGVAMSGGQKQRIAIARALIKKPAVLLLDEATSALDAASERVVQQSIDALAQSKAQTTIIIAHRLSTIRNADKICVINQGQIVEIGTHDELIAKNGQYADLVRLQMTAMEDNDAAADDEVEEEEILRENPEDAKKDEDHHPRSRTVSGERRRSRTGSLQEEMETGALVSVKKDEEKEEAISKEERSKVSQQIREMIFQYPTLLAIGLIGAAIFGAVFPGWGLLLANTQDMFYQSDPNQIREDATTFAYYYILLGGTCLFSSMGQYYGTVALGEKVSSQLRSEMFEAVMRRNIGFFDHEENNVGTITTQLADDSRTVHKAFGEGLAKQLQAIFTLSLGLALGFSASWKIAFVVLATFPLSIAASAVQMQAMKGQQYDTDSGDEQQKQPAAKSKKTKEVSPSDASVRDVATKEPEKNSTMSGGSGAVISTAFTHMRTVSAFSMHHKVAEHYAVLTRRSAEVRVGRSIVAAAGFGGSGCSMFLTYSLLFWYGAQLIKSGDVSFVELMSAILTLMLGALGLGNALADMGDQQAAIDIAHRIFRNINDGKNSPIDGISTKGVTPTERATGRIVLKDVSFKYPTRKNVEVCKGYNIVIEPGETVALVGPSGSGKSTIINLLLRFYDPDSGDISLDGTNIKDLNVRWLRSQIGYVGQEPVLFVGSVAENIARGRSENIYESLVSLQDAMKQAEEEYAADHPYYMVPCMDKIKADDKAANKPRPVPATEAGDIELGPGTGTAGHVDEDVIEACKLSNAHDFITTFPQGYDTDIGEGSIMVSGGQKQRIAIARALIKKPAVLLLDEATSALDAASERVVQQSIDALAQSKAQTTIIIAHRLSTIRNADKIIVIDHGTVAEVGKHDELLARANGLYKQLWEKQSGTGSAAHN